MQPIEETPGDDYECRPAAGDADGEAFRSLYETVWGRSRGRDWFQWRFRENPIGDARVTLVECDDGVVGAEACVPYRLRAGDRRALALQPVDWIVHPDHRRNGLARRMTERRIRRDGDAALYFNFPTPALRPLLDDLGWRTVTEGTTYYRVNDPAAIGRLGDDSTAAAVLWRLTAPLAKGYLRARDWLGSDDGDATVRSLPSVPAETLASLYRRDPPDGVHVERDADYYRWRFANPRWDCTTYLASRSGTVEAALVTCTETVGGVTLTRLAEALPLSGGSTEAFGALVAAAVDDHADADVLKTTAATLPASVLRACGFRADDGGLLGRVATKTAHVVRPLAADGWSLHGSRLDDPDAWCLSMAETDVA